MGHVARAASTAAPSLARATVVCHSARSPYLACAGLTFTACAVVTVNTIASCEAVDLSEDSLAYYQKFFEEMGGVEGQELTRKQVESHVGKSAKWKDLKAIAHILFTVLDQDASGSISFAEFACGVALIKSSREALSEEATKEFAWRALDMDRSGYIERAELVAWVKVLQGIGGIKASKVGVHYMGGGSMGGSFGRTQNAQEITSRFMKVMDANGA